MDLKEESRRRGEKKEGKGGKEEKGREARYSKTLRTRTS